MAPKSRPSEVVSWDLFKWIVSGLGGLLILLTGLAWHGLSDGLLDLKRAQRETTKEIAGISRVEMVRAVGAVERQIAVSNQKLS